MSVFLILSYIGMYYAYGNIMANAAIKQWNPYEVRRATLREHVVLLVPHYGGKPVPDLQTITHFYRF